MLLSFFVFVFFVFIFLLESCGDSGDEDDGEGVSLMFLMASLIFMICV